jgi:glycolate oxidase
VCIVVLPATRNPSGVQPLHRKPELHGKIRFMTPSAQQTTASRLLIADLEHVVGRRNVVWKPEDLLLYEYDGSIDRAAPRVVVLPGSAEEAAECVKVANRHDAFIVPRGAGTGLSGGAIPLRDSVVIGLARLNRILDVDIENRVAIVEPGLVNLELSNRIAKHGLYYAPDPSSQKACTIGGNVAENAGGPHCLALGTTTNHVLGIEVILADGTLLWLGGPERESTGYDLRGAFIGSEGTFGVVTKVAVRLLRIPEKIHTMLAAFTSLDAASQTVSDIIAAGIVPSALEMMDRVTIDACEPVYHPGYPADAEAVLIVELDGLTESVEEQSTLVEDVCNRNEASELRSADDPAKRAELWATRKGAIGAFGTIAPSYYLVDGVVPRTRLQQVMRQVKAVGDELGLTIGNVFHAGDGNLHPCILFNERNKDEVLKVIQAGERILEICVEHGGALSGEHGIGIEKQAYMPLVFTDDDMNAMKGLREAFLNPDHGTRDTGENTGKMPISERFNPGKIFPGGANHGEAYGITEHSVRRAGRADEV